MSESRFRQNEQITNASDANIRVLRFAHSIQFNAVPDWTSHYIAYSNLKKLCVLPNLNHAPFGNFVVAHPTDSYARHTGSTSSRRLFISPAHRTGMPSRDL